MPVLVGRPPAPARPRGDALTRPDWRDEVGAVLAALGRRARHLVDRLERVVDRDPFHVVGYLGYAAAGRALILGRAMQHEGLAAADPDAGRWRNLVHALKRFESDPLPFAAVRARVGGVEADLRADDEGFLRSWVALPAPLPAGGWHPVELRLQAPSDRATPPGTTAVLTRSPTARFGIISDMDDTVLQSQVTDFVRAAGTVLLENARTRLPFPGVAAFYRALVAGTGGEANPVFYVSNSPWNLYDVIEDFLAAQEIPGGPLLLRDWDLGLRLRRRPPHKPGAIAEILDAYPDLPFVLVGDSGQEDPEIYSETVRAHPGRILAVYIRNVRPHPERLAAVRRLAEGVVAQGSALVLADDTFAAARHAADHGWIDPEALPEIGGATRDDAGATGRKLPAPGVEAGAAPATVVVEHPGDLP